MSRQSHGMFTACNVAKHHDVLPSLAFGIVKKFKYGAIGTN